ncbi:AMP-dependent synthetase/ligase [Leptothoe kymatousa]|uniref:AMP-binding protein n=1 Tax=Leptothoe kymatousa TAU-MAC 1615 TaxID=2364775 RepID=A0ABS5XZL8_9CYAN|nr:AMP-binding protein [Leptothoe kymatousa]MBT9311016.1 AMP-binding protein [Leptothoe kymatousa TAU-MAC 1615]
MISKIMDEQCIFCCSLHVAPPLQGEVNLRYTIPSLLDMGCTYGHTPALHQWSAHGWKTYTYPAFRTAAEEVALGLRARGVTGPPGERGRIGLLLDSDVYWAMADMGGLLAGLVTVPMAGGQPMEATRWMLADADLQVLVVSTWGMLQTVYDLVNALTLVVVVEEGAPPTWLGNQPQVMTLGALRNVGRRCYAASVVQALRDNLHPDDLATIVYTADAGGGFTGAMLSHKSLTGNIMAAFSSMPGLQPGTPEVALSFLPLNHIFARAFLYGHFGFGHDIYFSSPRRVLRHLAAVKPTIFITVPRLLEKVYEKINGLRQQAWWGKRLVLGWAWRLAHGCPPRPQPSIWGRGQRWLWSHTVFRGLHRAFGGQVRYLLCGGAALQPQITTFFNGVGIPVKQGYGLTETSSVVSYTRDRWLRPGSVGAPIPGVEVRLAMDGEVLVKSLYTMVGYFRKPGATAAVIDPEGWFHTGDLGEFLADGSLLLRGCKKDLFKLSTGKYVAPTPVEEQLEQSPLVRQALVVGPGQKFCGVLFVPDLAALETVIAVADGGAGEWQTVAQKHYQHLLDQINGQLPHWSKIKRFELMEARADARLGRQQLYQIYGQEIEGLYRERQLAPPLAPPNSVAQGRRWRIFERHQRQTHIA